MLVATRNRPESLSKLLESLQFSSIHPTQVVVASSGDQIKDVIEKFSTALNITHIHIEGKGQIRQKMAGISLLVPTLSWVAFLDDDVILDPNAIENMFHTISNYPNSANLVGVGFSASNWKQDSVSLVNEIFSSFFGVSTRREGTVLRNGQNNNYMNSKTMIQTSWLNGASMWRKPIADTYEIPFLDASYSVCEDLIFSYQQSKKGILLYNPASSFAFQNISQIPQLNIVIFSALTYWRMYFVLTNEEFSINLFLWAQIGRTLHFAINAKGSFKERFVARKQSFSILFDVFSLTIKKVSPVQILKMRQSIT